MSCKPIPLDEYSREFSGFKDIELTKKQWEKIISEVSIAFPDLIALYLVGSYARDEQKHDSDIDFLAIFKNGSDRQMVERSEIDIKYVIKREINKLGRSYFSPIDIFPRLESEKDTIFPIVREMMEKNKPITQIAIWKINRGSLLIDSFWEEPVRVTVNKEQTKYDTTERNRGFNELKKMREDLEKEMKNNLRRI